MSTVSERPNVLERLGSAINSGDLSPDGERPRPIDLIGANGMLQVNPSGEKHAVLERVSIDPRTEIGPVLVRLKYAGDRTLGNRAERLLMNWIRHQRAFAKWKLKPGGDGLLERFTRQGLAEWLFPVCQECHGREVLGMDRGEIKEKRISCSACKSAGRQRVGNVMRQCGGCAGFGWRTKRKVMTTKARMCDRCNGTGHHRVSDAERSIALGVDLHVYQKHWARRFSWLADAFDRIDGTEKNCLRVQLTSG